LIDIILLLLDYVMLFLS